MALRGSYDVIVLDRMLPGMDGLAVLRALRAAQVRMTEQSQLVVDDLEMDLLRRGVTRNKQPIELLPKEFALRLTGTELNIAAMMGLTMVSGIIAEPGVFYFAELPDGEINHAHRVDAGSARLRPILMSALIAILALAPLALVAGPIIHNALSGDPADTSNDLAAGGDPG